MHRDKEPFRPPYYLSFWHAKEPFREIRGEFNTLPSRPAYVAKLLPFSRWKHKSCYHGRILLKQARESPACALRRTTRRRVADGKAHSWRNFARLKGDAMSLPASILDLSKKADNRTVNGAGGGAACHRRGARRPPVHRRRGHGRSWPASRARRCTRSTKRTCTAAWRPTARSSPAATPIPTSTRMPRRRF